ncbi:MULTISPECIES: CidA/LrgA family protein [unclassified Janthinobacterium]|uniref:CidA/LrgA family protein n=1 Tax=unclassified Janthinobacterium TaxID=2610881 RepID=UPI0018DEEA54|nr:MULTISPECIES: CidA/LrgA family protein [unclassified Janthinobacterium]MEC5162859.1 holin-like protein [Janthinobacterium sp. CG_S6]
MFGFAFFIAMYLLGNYLSSQFSLPIPGSIIGFGLVFILLTIRGKVDAPLKEASDSMLRYLALMLVPIGVGVMKLIGAVPPGISKLMLVLVVALVVGGVATAKITQWLLARHVGRSNDSTVPATAALHKAGAAQ